MSAMATYAGAPTGESYVAPCQYREDGEKKIVIASCHEGVCAQGHPLEPRLGGNRLKGACTVLRGGGSSNAISLPDRYSLVAELRLISSSMEKPQA